MAPHSPQSLRTQAALDAMIGGKILFTHDAKYWEKDIYLFRIPGSSTYCRIKIDKSSINVYYPPAEEVHKGLAPEGEYANYQEDLLNSLRGDKILLILSLYLQAHNLHYGTNYALPSPNNDEEEEEGHVTIEHA